MMNGYFGLSHREAEVYSFIVKLDTEWRPMSDNDYKDILSTTNRKLLIRECNINKTNLSRFVAYLRDKGLIVLNSNGGYEVPANLSLQLTDNIVETVFTFEVVSDEGTG